MIVSCSIERRSAFVPCLAGRRAGESADVVGKTGHPRIHLSMRIEPRGVLFDHQTCISGLNPEGSGTSRGVAGARVAPHRIHSPTRVADAGAHGAHGAPRDDSRSASIGACRCEKQASRRLRS